jgi:hypothetical protein
MSRRRRKGREFGSLALLHLLMFDRTTKRTDVKG